MFICFECRFRASVGAGILADMLIYFECRFGASVGAGILADMFIYFECRFGASVGAGILADMLIYFECRFRASVGAGILADMFILNVESGLPYRNVVNIRRSSIRSVSPVNKFLEDLYCCVRLILFGHLTNDYGLHLQ